MPSDSPKGGGKKRERKEEELMTRTKTSPASAVKEEAPASPAFHETLPDAIKNPKKPTALSNAERQRQYRQRAAETSRAVA